MSDLEATKPNEDLPSAPAESGEAQASVRADEPGSQEAPQEPPRLPDDDPRDGTGAPALPAVELGQPLPTLNRPLRDVVPAARRVLNLGCGTTYVPGALNTDRLDRTVCDVVADGRRLPIADGSLDEVRLCHVLQGVGYLGALEVLGECCRTLRPGGLLVLEAPDAEPYCQAFVEEAALRGEPSGLRWLLHFRNGNEGLGVTNTLLPERLLVGMLEEAGFEVNEPTEVGSTGGSLLLRARRGGSAHAHWLAATRAAVGASELLHGWPADERLELERRYFGALRALPGLHGREALVVALETLLIHPALASLWIQAAQSDNVALPVDLLELADLAARASAAGLDRVLWAAVARVAVTPHELDAPLEVVERCALQALHTALGDPGADIEALVDERLREQLTGHAFGGLLANYRWLLPDRGALLHSRLVSVAQRILARAVRHLEKGALSAGRQGVQLAANLRRDPLYALWNLAIVQVKVGNYERAISFLRAARVHAVAPRERAALDQEEAACLTLLGDEELATPLLARAAACLATLEGGPSPGEPLAAGPAVAAPVQPRWPVVPTL